MHGRPTWRPPEEFDEYRIVRELGAGAMGQVYLAHDTLLDRSVAVKFLGAGEISDLARERFLVEARALARLQHPNVVTVYRVGELGRRPYLVSEFIHGESLDRVPKPMPWQRVRELAIMLARGLAAAHRRGVLHRDIKPANTILASDDNEVKLLDFGLAKLVDMEGAGRGSLRAGSTPPMATATPAATPRPVGFDETQDIDAMGPTGAVRADDAKQLLGDDETMASGSNPRLDDTRSPSVSPSLTRDGAVMGTPYYMAPEAWRGEQATVRSDLYSLGVMLYELACGAPPHRDIPVAHLSARIQVERATPLAERVPGIDAKFAVLVDRCLALDPAERFGAADELREALEALAIPSTAAAPALTIPEGNPYRGLRTFEAEHRALFFGRGPEVRSIVERLRTDPFVLVAGDSGVGKSSLVRAGVIPSVLDGALGGGRAWRTSTIVPGRRPLVAVATELARQFELDEATFESDLLRRDTVAIEKHRRTILKSLSKHQQGFLLVIDQLEELVTIADAEEAGAVVELLAALFSSSSARGIRLVATVRGDFLTRVAALPWLGDELAHALYVLRPMTAEGIREAIVGPARAKGVHFEPPSLVDELVEASRTSSSLPLLQFALAELWDARPADAKTITAEALSAIGGVDGALARHADRVLAEMLPEVRAAAKRIVVGLVSAEGTRARRSRPELVIDDASGKALEALVRGRLVSVRDAEGEAGYEVAHEALLARWDTLRDWLDTDGELRIVRRRIEAAAVEWERLGRTKQLLLAQRQLDEAARVPIDSMVPVARELVQTSQRARRRAQVRRVLLVAAIPLTILAVVLFIRNRVEAGDRKRRQAAITERDRRVAEHTAAASGLQREVDKDRAALEQARAEAFALFDAKRLEDGEAKWAEAQRLANIVDVNQARIAEDLEHALVIDPSRDDVRRRLAEMLYARAELADHLRLGDRRDELLRRLALHDTDGSLRGSWDRPASLSLTIDPGDARVTISRIVVRDGIRVEESPRPANATEQLAPGGYLLSAEAPGRAPVRLPVQLERGEQLPVSIALPLAERVPPGFIFIPEGRFLIGSADEQVRRGFLSTVPLHAARTGAYLIAKHEVTYEEWIRYLEALSPAEQERRRPHGAAPPGVVDLRKIDGTWRLRLQPTIHAYDAPWGTSIRYLDRTVRVEHDWRRMPVSSIAAADAIAYAAWLRETKRLPKARLCTEHEWERAARGADDREFPHGDVMRPTDGNFDETYGKIPRAMGPDQVGSYPQIRSPFGLEDMTGNIGEWTQPSISSDIAAMRGGAFYWGSLTGRATNRWTSEPSLRNVMIGLRLCADP